MNNLLKNKKIQIASIILPVAILGACGTKDTFKNVREECEKSNGTFSTENKKIESDNFETASCNKKSSGGSTMFYSAASNGAVQSHANVAAMNSSLVSQQKQLATQRANAAKAAKSSSVSTGGKGGGS